VIPAQWHYRRSETFQHSDNAVFPRISEKVRGLLFCGWMASRTSPGNELQPAVLFLRIFELSEGYLVGHMDKDPDAADRPGLDRTHVFIRPLPLVLTAICAGTALSVYVSSPFLDVLLWRTGKSDVLINLLLYIPLGAAMARHGVLKCGLAGAVVSITIEMIQLFYPDRYTAVSDVVSNTLGAMLGCIAINALGFRWRRFLDRFELSRPVGALLLTMGVLFIGVVSWPRMPSDFRNWDTECLLSLGDDVDGDRLWTGEIFEVMVLPIHLDAGAIQTLSFEDHERAAHMRAFENQAVFSRRFSDDFDSVRGKSLLTPRDSIQFFDSLTRWDKLTILVWFRTDSETQGGPARIVSYATSIWRQNFMLGQEGRDIVFRVLTPTSAPGGFTPQLETRGVLRSGQDAFVAATYDGRNSRVYLDGRFIGRLNLSARGRTVPFLADSGLPASSLCIGVVMGLAAVALMRRYRRRRWLTGACAGLIGGVIFVFAGGVDALPGFAPWVPLLALGGGFMAGISTRLSSAGA
jgi:hypothetical protein